MSESVLERPAPRTRTPVHLWIVGVLAVLWNGMGAFDYLATEMRLDFYMSQFSQEQLDYFYGFPAWLVAAWAIAVWSALVASVGLLLRRRWAVWLFGLSIVGMAVTTLHNFVLSDGSAVMGSGAITFTVVIWVVAILLFLYARWQASKGVLV
jgi:hypothetical protein